jgi:cytochrome c oxidase subunit 3
MASTTQAGGTPHYFIPAPSQHPVMVSLGMLLVIFGASQWVNGHGYGAWLVLAGLVFWAFVMFRWFGDAIRESEGGLYSDRIDVSYRWSMGWFIFSEVMFFAAFFGALYWARVFSVPMPFQTMGPFWLPTINTALLLTSGVTLTIAHHALLANQRSKTIFWMWITVALGVTFLGVQAYEYIHAYRDLNLKLTSGIFGSTFFMLTGFHGFHVFVGMLMLVFITLRLMKGHFTPQRHFGFEGAAWYWHFVDVVWLGLYFLVYWL